MRIQRFSFTTRNTIQPIMVTIPRNHISAKYLLCLVIFCVSLITAPNIFAADPGKPKPPAKPKAQAQPKPPAKPQPQAGGLDAVLKKYDLDKNKIINVEESAMIQEAYGNNPQDPTLKKYDTNKDSKLSDAEIMKISPIKAPPAKPKPAKPAPGKKKGKKK